MRNGEIDKTEVEFLFSINFVFVCFLSPLLNGYATAAATAVAAAVFFIRFSTISGFICVSPIYSFNT